MNPSEGLNRHESLGFIIFCLLSASILFDIYYDLYARDEWRKECTKQMNMDMDSCEYAAGLKHFSILGRIIRW